MTNSQKLQRLERAKAREQMRQSGKKYQEEYFDKKERLEKHYGYYIAPDDYDAMDFEYELMHNRAEKEERDWQEFSERHLPEAERTELQEDNRQWIARLSSVLEFGLLNNKTREICYKYRHEPFNEIRFEYNSKVTDDRHELVNKFKVPRSKKVFYRDKDGNVHITPEAKVNTCETVAHRILYLAEQYLDEHDNKFPSVHYLQQIDSNKKTQQLDKPIDKTELLVYEVLFDALKIARSNIGHRPEEAKRITELGKRFLTKEDQKHLQKTKPYFNPKTLLMLQKYYEQNC